MRLARLGQAYECAAVIGLRESDMGEAAVARKVF
jgi:hypothetical protein